MATTRTPGITVLADGRRFIDKLYLGIRIGLRVGALTQEQAEERLRVEMARVEYEIQRKGRIAVGSHPRPSPFVRVSFARRRRFRGRSRSTARPCQSFDGWSLRERRCGSPAETSKSDCRPERHADAITDCERPMRTCG